MKLYDDLSADGGWSLELQLSDGCGKLEVTWPVSPDFGDRCSDEHVYVSVVPPRPEKSPKESGLKQIGRDSAAHQERYDDILTVEELSKRKATDLGLPPGVGKAHGQGPLDFRKVAARVRELIENAKIRQVMDS